MLETTHASTASGAPASEATRAAPPSTPIPQAPPAPPSAAVTPKRRWPWFAAGAVVLGSMAVVTWTIFAPQANVSTDAAYVRVHYATIAPRVPGQVMTVAAENDQTVKAGDLLVQLDDRDYRAAVAQARAVRDRDQAAIENADASVTRQAAVIAQAQAQIVSNQAQLRYAETDATRTHVLATQGAGTLMRQQQADASLTQDRAAVDNATAALAAARVALASLQAQAKSARATVQADAALLQQAELSLGYTQIRAPVDGMVASRAVQVGDYVAAGAGLMSVVPLSDIYIEADYREVQLQHVRPGQPARIHVDAYNIDLNGTVVAIPAATGATFAPIQPDNATGNFTKIVQRLPVQIRIAPHQKLAPLLRVGMSVETTIQTGLADVVGLQLSDAQHDAAPKGPAIAVAASGKGPAS